MKTRQLCAIALMAALLCVAAPLAVPVGPIPITLATFVMYLTGALLGMKLGGAAVGLYILIGAVGLPVFSGFSGGLSRLVGVTGGYIVGYVPLVLTVGVLTERFGEKKWMYPLSMVLGTAELYALGTIWFMLQSGTGLQGALAACVLPFLPGDIAKIAAATALSWILHRRVPQLVH